MTLNEYLNSYFGNLCTSLMCVFNLSRAFEEPFKKVFLSKFNSEVSLLFLKGSRLIDHSVIPNVCI